MDVLLLNKHMSYMVFGKVAYGIMPTFNSFVFMKRHSPGVLHMSRMIPNASTTPTIMKLLYYLSHLCAVDTDPHPELDSEGNELHRMAAPKIPDPNYIRPERTTLPSDARVGVELWTPDSLFLLNYGMDGNSPRDILSMKPPSTINCETYGAQLSPSFSAWAVGDFVIFFCYRLSKYHCPVHTADASVRY